MKTVFLVLLVTPVSLYAQRHYGRNPGPGDFKGGIQILLIGGAIWGVGMVTVLAVNAVIGKEKNNALRNFGAALAVIGGLTAFWGLLTMGF